MVIEHVVQSVEVLENSASVQGVAFCALDGSGTDLGIDRPWRQERAPYRLRASLASVARNLVATSYSGLSGLPGTSRRRWIVSRFVSTAASGDVPSFTSNLRLIDWPGAWPEIFLEIVRVGFVHDAVWLAFRDAWRGAEGLINGADILAERMNWSLTRDFDRQLDLLVDGLRLLMPQTQSDRPVYALYRGQGLAEHEAGRHGVWWTPDPLYAELYARMLNRLGSGTGAVVVAIAPEEAVTTSLCGTEFLVDPRRLEDVTLVAELPPYRSAYVYDPLQASRLLGIPSGYSFEELDHWLKAGLPVSGLESCRRSRERHISPVT